MDAELLRGLVAEERAAWASYHCWPGTVHWQRVCEAQAALKEAAVNALPGLLDELDALRAKVAALSGPLAQGRVMVPRVPTLAMHNAAALSGLCGEAPRIDAEGRIVWKCADPSAVYAAMLAAAPAQPDRVE